MHLLALLLPLLFWPATRGPAPPTPPADTLRILFVGNSLTYTNDLPALVGAIVAGDGRTTVETRSIAFPDVSLTEHRLGGQAERVIRQGGWSLVILQQGPSSLAESRVQLVAEARWFSRVAREAGVPLALLMVWPDRSRRGFFDEVATSYRLAADSAGAMLLPAGSAWREAWKSDPALPLYGGDGFHPSPVGSLLAALVIADRLRPGRLERLTAGEVPVRELPETRLRMLIAAARRANAGVRP
jgi:hypothetical protein